MSLLVFTMLSGLGALFMAYALVKFSGESNKPKRKAPARDESILVKGCAAKIVAFTSAASSKNKQSTEARRGIADARLLVRPGKWGNV